MNKLLFVLAVFLAFAFTTAAQTTTGSLTGTVSGPDGALPGATVTATDNGTKKEQTVTTGPDGTFRFNQLEFGTYTVPRNVERLQDLHRNGTKDRCGPRGDTESRS